MDKNSIDVIEIKPSEKLLNLKKSDKLRLIDSYMNPKDETKRGLQLDFNLSSAGRVINMRVYKPKTQRDGANTWVTPYPRPIIRNHDDREDPLGRITNVVARSLDDVAIPFLPTQQDYFALKRVLEDGDPQKMYRALKKYRLLERADWPGVQELIATARIYDQEAIEKFLDGRYLTFSAQASTNSLKCGVCGSDWYTGDICDHRPGEYTKDGDIGIFIPDQYRGVEASVLSNPANIFSVVRNMNIVSLKDSKIPENIIEECFPVSLQDKISTTLEFNLEDVMPETDKKEDGQEVKQESEVTLKDADSLINKIADAVLAKLAPKAEEKSKETEEAIPWGLLDALYAVEVGVLPKQRTGISDEAYIGLDKTIPIETIDAAEIAKGLVEKAKLSDNQKKEFLVLVDKRIDSIKIADNKQLVSLREDYRNALKQVDDLKAENSGLKDQLISLQEKLEKLDKEKTVEQNTNKVTIKDQGSIKDPSESGTEALDKENQKKNKIEDAFTSQVVEKYKELLTKKNGKTIADAYIYQLKSRQTLPQSFQIATFLSENE